LGVEPFRMDGKSGAVLDHPADTSRTNNLKTSPPNRWGPNKKTL